MHKPTRYAIVAMAIATLRGTAGPQTPTATTLNR